LIDGFDDGVKTSRQEDYEQAIMNAKKQAIERAGIKMSVEKKYGRKYREKNGRNSIEKYSDNEIESYASGVLAPGYTFDDYGYQKDGSYKVTLRGHIIQDPAVALRNHTENIDRNYPAQTPTAFELLRNSAVQEIFERRKANLRFDFSHPSGTITFQILTTFSPRPGINCRTAEAAYSWTPERCNFTACRDRYTGRWNLN